VGSEKKGNKMGGKEKREERRRAMIFLWEVGDILKINMEICKTAKEVNN